MMSDISNYGSHNLSKLKDIVRTIIKDMKQITV